MTPRDGSGQSWLDREAGPVVRPYALTKGRTIPDGREPLGLIDIVAATGERPVAYFRPGPEHRRILRICQRPTAIVDLTSEIGLPLGVVRVLLGDLISQGMLRIVSAQRDQAPDLHLLRKVLHGLQSL
jgi:hypothetical protein